MGWGDRGPAAPPGAVKKGTSAKKSNMGKARASSPSGVAHVEVRHFSRPRSASHLTLTRLCVNAVERPSVFYAHCRRALAHRKRAPEACSGST